MSLIQTDGTRADPEKTKAIIDMSPPTVPLTVKFIPRVVFSHVKFEALVKTHATRK